MVIPDSPAGAQPACFAGTVAGLVLAGGASRRMGADKAGLRLGPRPPSATAVAADRADGETLLAHACARLALARHSGLIAAFAIAGGPENAALCARLGTAFGAAVLSDPLPGHQGPLAGMLAGLRWAAAGGHGRMVTIPVDTPFFPADLIARLAADAGPAACAACNGRTHPAFAALATGLAGDLAATLAGGGRRLMEWLARQPGFHTVGFPATENDDDPFSNLNACTDLAAARRRLKRLAGA